VIHRAFARMFSLSDFDVMECEPVTSLSDVASSDTESSDTATELFE